MFRQYDKIECSCGKDARVVICGVGCYIHCPYCDLSTHMTSNREAAEKRWKELKKLYEKKEVKR